MKKLLLGLILGLAAGYTWGFGEARDGQANVALRALNKFGVATVKATHQARQAQAEEAARP